MPHIDSEEQASVRADLLAICERASVPQADWSNRDSYQCQFQMGECWALLKAGCDFVVHGPDGDPASDDKTIWLTTYGEGFAFHEGYERGDNRADYLDDELHYLPTAARLDALAGKDWYS